MAKLAPSPSPLAVEALSDGFVSDDQATATFLGSHERPLLVLHDSLPYSKDVHN